MCAYIHTYMHTCIRAFMHTCTHAHMNACMHAYMHTCIHAYIHTYLYIHRYIHIFSLSSPLTRMPYTHLTISLAGFLTSYFTPLALGRGPGIWRQQLQLQVPKRHGGSRMMLHYNSHKAYVTEPYRRGMEEPPELTIGVWLLPRLRYTSFQGYQTSFTGHV